MNSNHPDPTRSKHPHPHEARNAGVRPLSRQPGRWLPLAGLCLGLAVAGAVTSSALRAQQAPGLSINLVPTNQTMVEIKVTNAVAGAQYELQRVDDFNYLANPEFVWPSPEIGALGQTNFLVEIGIFQSGFLRVLGCIDCDNDGVPNWQDASPFNTNSGILFITIDSPTNSANIQ